MRKHRTIQGLLPLAAAGELSREEQLLVKEHLRSCPDCASELAQLQHLAGKLHLLPQPGPPSYLLERTLRRVEQQMTASAARRSESLLLIMAVSMGWLFTLAVWALSSYLLGGRDGSWWLCFVVSTVLSWSTAGVAAVLLSCQQRIERRTYALASQ
jgi:anti-sigma factor RsiW